MLEDTGERIIPPKNGEVSYLFERHKMAYLFAANYCHDTIRVLDAGSGTGYGSQLLAESGAQVYGADYFFDALAYAKAHFPHQNLNLVVMNLGSLGFKEHTFDLIVSFQVIEHMPDLKRFLSELIRVLKSSGTIIFSTPNVSEKQKQKGSDNVFHFNEITYREARELMESHFNHVEFYGTQYSQKNFLRTIIQKFFLYRTIGRMIPRKNVIKKFAKATLKLDEFRISKTNINKAMDLIIVVRSPKVPDLQEK